MILPLSFLLGLALLVVQPWLIEVLPGDAAVERLLPWLPLLMVPWLWMHVLQRRLQRLSPLRIGRARLPLRLAHATAPLTVPACFAALVYGGHLPDVVSEHLARSSSGLFVALTVLPLAVMEVSFRLAEQAAVQTVDGLPMGAGLRRGYGLLALPATALILLPLLGAAAMSDLVRGSRELDVFVQQTSIGGLSAFVVAIAGLSVMLPLLFRYLLPTSRELPDRHRADVHLVARALGFRPTQVLTVRTGMRVVNAALVGPLPWPRFLVLSDGLLALLDPFALRGVVAHEVGHARGSHAAVLLLVFAVWPALLFHPVELWLRNADMVIAFGVLGAAVLLGVLLLRTIAHRFELEADHHAVWALGGGAECIEALRRVGELAPRSIHRGSLRHPSERARIERMLRWERDPVQRARFQRRGRTMRRLIAAGTAVVVAVSAWGHASLWRVDSAGMAFALGDFRGAQARLDAIADDAPEALRAVADDLRPRVQAALQLIPEGGPWCDIRDHLAELGLEHGTRLLRRGEAEAAMPYLSLSLSGPDPDVYRRMLWLIGDAARHEDAARVARLRDHLARIGSPPDVLEVVRDL